MKRDLVRKPKQQLQHACTLGVLELTCSSCCRCAATARSTSCCADCAAADRSRAAAAAARAASSAVASFDSRSDRTACSDQHSTAHHATTGRHGERADLVTRMIVRSKTTLQTLCLHPQQRQQQRKASPHALPALPVVPP